MPLLGLALALAVLSTAGSTFAQESASAKLFGQKYKNVETMAVGEWWKVKPNKRRTMNLNVPRDQVVAFAVYTHDHGVLKMSAQLFPLMPDEAKQVRLEFKDDSGNWNQVAEQAVIELGWSAHFRLEDWDNSKDVAYRVRHGDKAQFEGLIRKDPSDKDVIVVGNLSCNSSRTPGPRPKMIDNLKKLNPDVLFFAGDQSYHHTEHTYGWLEFGMQFRDLLRDRPAIAIPDDHDVGQANIWGENGKQAATPSGPTGGYFFPSNYVNMVQRCQTWHLPDPYDATPIERDISVYYTDLTVGGINFAIIEDRKFKSGPEGKIPKMGPRPDHINDPKYDRAAVDLPELKLLGDRQLKFLNKWSQDWTGAEMKCVLSQTAFCGAVHLHGSENNRLLADLDSNAWPQTGRNKALTEIRRAWAPHLCGDQHLAVFVKHGIDEFGDGPYAFTSPALVNTIYGRRWWPEDEKPGANPIAGSPLPWTGDFLDGLGNKISMMAYANPPDRTDEQQRADGFGIVRFNKKTQQITAECWPRFADASGGDSQQFPGWPITFNYRDNDGRKPVAHLPTVDVKGTNRPVIQVVEESTGEILYTIRATSNRFRPPVYSNGKHTIKVGTDKPNQSTTKGVMPLGEGKTSELSIDLQAVKVSPALKVLVVAGGCCHDYKTQTKLIKEGIEDRLHAEVTVVLSEDTSTKAVFDLYESDDWAKGFDVIVHDECSANVTERPYVDRILNAHRNGVPAVNLHCAMHSYRWGNFREPVADGADNASWYEMLGVQSTGHGPKAPIDVIGAGSDHPVLKGFEGWKTIDEELYNNVRVFSGASVLVKGKQLMPPNKKALKQNPNAEPKESTAVIAWTNLYGPKKTRIFSTSLGHQNDTVADARYMDFVVRGLLWATNNLGGEGKKSALLK
ncbi:MAG: ThuA domain-containing protein [Rubripirellula sp.]